MLYTVLLIILVYLLLPKGYITFWPTLMPCNKTDALEVLNRMENRNANEYKLFFESDPGVHKTFARILPGVSEKEIRYISTKQNIFLFFLKYIINRPRPYQVIPAIRDTMLQSFTDETPAYPAGHTYQGFLAAKHYANLFPELADTLYQAAEDIGQSRVAAGIHYPSDHAISKKLALMFG